MEEVKLSEQQVNSVIEFAKGLAVADGYFSPWMSNQLMRNLNNNPKMPSGEKLRKALVDYKNSGYDLQAYTEFMQKWDMIFARTLQSYANMLSMDLQLVCSNAFTDDDYNSDAYKEDKKRIERFLDSFDYKAEFHKILVEVLRHEVSYVWFRKTKWGNKGMKGTLQILPQDRCMLTGYWEKGLLFDFDMAYFLNQGVDIDGFDPVFKKYYQKIFGDGSEYQNYVPTNTLNNRTGTFAFWTQTSPADGAFPFKMDLSNFTEAPFLAPFLKESLRNDEIAALQYDKDMMEAYGILAGEIRLFDNAHSGTKANQFAIDPKTLGTFMGAVKRGLDSNMKAVAMPTENTKFYQFEDTNKDMLKNQLGSAAATGTGVSRIIYSTDRMGSFELQAALEAQYQIMQPMYYQFQNFMEYYGNKLTKKYKFKFIFDGCSYEFAKAAKFDRLMKMADRGMILNPSAYAFAVNMTPQDFERSLNEAKSSRWYKGLGLFPNTNTNSAGSGVDGAGRPTKDVSQISESTEQSRNQ